MSCHSHRWPAMGLWWGISFRANNWVLLSLDEVPERVQRLVRCQGRLHLLSIHDFAGGTTLVPHRIEIIWNNIKQTTKAFKGNEKVQPPSPVLLLPTPSRAAWTNCASSGTHTHTHTAALSKPGSHIFPFPLPHLQCLGLHKMSLSLWIFFLISNFPRG